MKYSFLICSFIFFAGLKAQNILRGEDVRKSSTQTFIPVSFYNKFSLNIKPVLTLNDGDTVATETIDAMGYDKKGVKRQRGGNPLTSPFYIENANPGDVLAIQFTKLSLNRTYAYTTEGFVGRSLNKEANRTPKRSRLVKWELDTLKKDVTPKTACITG